MEPVTRSVCIDRFEVLVYAAAAPDGRVIALLQDGSSRTENVVVLLPAVPNF